MTHLPARLAAASLIVLLAACSHSAGQAGATASPGATTARATKTIGVSIQNREAQFYQVMETGMQAEAKKFGYKLEVVDANRDNARQQSQVEDFISQKVNAIVLIPYDSQAIGSAIAEANRAKIPVFTADIASTSKIGKVLSYIASDNVQGGVKAADLLCKGIGGKGEVAIIDEPEVTSVQDRVKGFRRELKAKCPGAKIVADVDAGGQRDRAASDMSDVLQSHPHVKGVFGINDDSALGALTAVQQAGLVGKVAIVGFDATPEARTAIAKGQMYGDVVQYPKTIGKLTIDTIHSYFAGKKISRLVHVSVGTFTKADAGKPN
ncbi:MAG: substrate-binding domain-containing protein [Vulcanimicrobiaceae bacterium]